jgi:hypothetical protein
MCEVLLRSVWVSSSPSYIKGEPPARSRGRRGLHWRIETVNGPLAGRVQAQRTWAKDLWQLCSRRRRKILSHTIAAWLNVSQGHRPLDFASLVTE